MKLTIDKKMDEDLLSREKILATLEFENAIPSRKDVLAEIAKKVNAKPELVTVQSITPSFGSKKIAVVAYVYKSKEVLVKIVDKKILAKIGHKEEKKAEAPAAGAQ